MITQEREVKLKDGRSCILKTPERNGQAELEFYLSVLAETDFLALTPKEAEGVTAEGEEVWLKSFENNHSFIIGAYLENELVGQISADVSALDRIKHVGIVGISVSKKAWGLGVASSLFVYLEEEVKKHGITILQLDLFSDNENAHRLYKKWGFQDCGVFHSGLKHADGRFVDKIMMEKIL